MKAIILAAGRGSRMETETQQQPKCLLSLGGKPLLQWQLEALHHNGITDILIVCGYLSQKITAALKKWMKTCSITILHNPRWAETNMVRTLLYAFPSLDETPTVIVYADIVFHSRHLRDLLTATGDLCLTYDTEWESLWRLRQEHPLTDAETFRTDNDRLVEIGNIPSKLEDIQGQYMGLLKLTVFGRMHIENILKNFSEKEIDHLDMTALLQRLLHQKVFIQTVPVVGAWCECDTQQDIMSYEGMLRKGGWIHDWRE